MSLPQVYLTIRSYELPLFVCALPLRQTPIATIPNDHIVYLYHSLLNKSGRVIQLDVQYATISPILLVEDLGILQGVRFRTNIEFWLYLLVLYRQVGQFATLVNVFVLYLNINEYALS